MLAAKTTVPVLGVPVPSRHLQGQDSLLSIVQMPKGVPVATVAVKEFRFLAPVAVGDLADSSVNLAVRPWIKAADYAPASHELTERMKKALDEAGISSPFPQRDVHLYTQEPVAPAATRALASVTEDESPASRERTPSTGLDADSTDAPEGRGDDDGEGGR